MPDDIMNGYAVEYKKIATGPSDDRSYHEDPDSKYPCPNDELEQNRLSTQHDAILALMHNRPFHAPVDPSTVKVALDIGCGTGQMTLLLAQHFPNATIYGIDISPVPTSTQAEAEHLGRVHFLEGNILTLAGTHPALQPGSVDFIYHRLLAVGMKSYMVYLRDAVAPLLKPAGFVEMHDIMEPSLYAYKPEGIVRLSDAWEWPKMLRKQCELRGEGFQYSEHGFEAIVTTLQLLDFEDVQQKMYRLPWAPVPGKPETEAWAKHAITGIPTIYASALRHMLLENGADMDLVETAEKEIWDTVGVARDGAWWLLFAAWGRKAVE